MTAFVLMILSRNVDPSIRGIFTTRGSDSRISFIACRMVAESSTIKTRIFLSKAIFNILDLSYPTPAGDR